MPLKRGEDGKGSQVPKRKCPAPKERNAGTRKENAGRKRYQKCWRENDGKEKTPASGKRNAPVPHSRGRGRAKGRSQFFETI